MFILVEIVGEWKLRTHVPGGELEGRRWVSSFDLARFRRFLGVSDQF